MGNTVTITQNLSYTINNPTMYSPDAVIKGYVERRRTDVQTEIQNLTGYEISQEQAAQKLFDRAVDDVEFQNYKCAGIKHCCYGLAFELMNGLLILITLNSNWDKQSAGAYIYMFHCFALLEILHVLGNIFFGIIMTVLLA